MVQLFWQFIFLIFFQVSCTAFPEHQGDIVPTSPIDISRIPNAIPRHEPLSRRGNGPVYTVLGRRYWVLEEAKGYRKRGLASWYGRRRLHHNLTASGEPYDITRMTAAHRTLPIPTYVRVTHLKNKRQVVVRINDRGPFVGDRLIDLSYVAAKKLDIVREGTAWVEVQALTPSGAIPPPQTHLQLGVFSTRQSAIDIVARLKATMSIGHFRVQSHKVNQRTLYRVIAGPFHMPDQLQWIQKKLKRAGFNEWLLISDPNSYAC